MNEKTQKSRREEREKKGEWKKITPPPHSKQSLTTKTNSKISLQATTNTIFGSQFYADIIYMSLFTIPFTLVLTLYFLLLKQTVTNLTNQHTIDFPLKINQSFQNS